MGNRIAATQSFLKTISLYPSKYAKHNVEVARKYFDSLSDKEFEEMIVRMEKGEETLRFCVKNYEDDTLNKFDGIIDAFKPMYAYLKAPILQRFWYTDPSSGEEMASKFPALLCYLPNRMMNQLMAKKRSVARDNNSVDELTGQPTGKARVSTFSAPEAIVAAGKDHKYLVMDFNKIRGGDERAYALSKQMIYNTGTYSIDKIVEQDSNVTSKVIYSTILTAMHFKNNIWKEELF